MAAQSVVRRGYEDPIETYSSNVMGTVHLLEALRQLGGHASWSTSRVTSAMQTASGSGDIGRTSRWAATILTQIRRACAELVTTAYRDSYFLRWFGASCIAVASAERVTSSAAAIGPRSTDSGPREGIPGRPALPHPQSFRDSAMAVRPGALARISHACRATCGGRLAFCIGLEFRPGRNGCEAGVLDCRQVGNRGGMAASWVSDEAPIPGKLIFSNWTCPRRGPSSAGSQSCR